MSAAWMRLRGLLRKEVLQILRDPSSLLLAVVMPVVLLVLFGFGVSLNPRRVPIAVVAQASGSSARDLVARFEGTRYFDPRGTVSMPEAVRRLRRGEVDGVLHVRDDFEADLLGAPGAAVQLVLDGVDSNRASLLRGYAAATLARAPALRAARGEPVPRPAVAVEARTWFNAANESRHFLVPGLVVLIMTLIGTLLTALVVAREWERGTMEAICATPLRPRELLLGKTLPYFALGLMGLGVSVLGAVWLFGVPLRGSPWVLAACSALFLLAALGLGLAFSAVMRVQFVAAQAAVVAGFLPAFFLSGLLFDLESTPAAIQWISRIVPARYFVEIAHTLFLAGDVPAVVLPAAGALALAALVFLSVARARLGTRLE